MFEIQCTSCHTSYIVGTRSLLALNGEPHALHGVARCPLGHEVAVDFSTPDPADTTADATAGTGTRHPVAA